jgi:hypothetical protein
MQRDRVFRKASCSSLGAEDILAIFRQGYLTEESVTKALVTVVRGKFRTAALERLLYFHSASADHLLHDGFARRATRLNQSEKTCLLRRATTLFLPMYSVSSPKL